MNICFIINSWDTIDPEKETTMRLIHESYVRGHNVGVLSPNNLTIRNNVTYGFVKILLKKQNNINNLLMFHKKMKLGCIY